MSLKCEPSLAEALRAEHSAVRPGYHLNKRHWITVTLDDTLPDELVLGLLEDSYELVVDGLRKRERDLVRSRAPKPRMPARARWGTRQIVAVDLDGKSPQTESAQNPEPRGCLVSVGSVAWSRADHFSAPASLTVESKEEGAGMGANLSTESNVGDGQLAGKCGCGAVRYQVADEFLYAANCHCSRCRAATGSAFKPFAGIEREKLEITDGLDRLLLFGEEDSNDTRCAACGSLLFSVVRQGAYVHVALGSLVDAPTIRPGGHIFVGSKASWFEITDDLPQFEELD